MPSTLNLVNSLAEYEMTLVETSPIESIENSYIEAPLLQNIVGEMEESVEQGLMYETWINHVSAKRTMTIIHNFMTETEAIYYSIKIYER